MKERTVVSCELRLEAATMFDIVHLFSEGNLRFVWEKSGNYEVAIMCPLSSGYFFVTVRSNCLVLSLQDFQQDLQIQLAEYNFIFSLGTTIKMKASEDCKARIEDQLNSISSLKKSLFDEIDSHLQNLNSKSKQWEEIQEQMDTFVEYMDKVDSRLERSRRESRVSQEWLAQVKVR